MAGASGQEPEESPLGRSPDDAAAGRQDDARGGMGRGSALLGIGFEFVAAICLFGAIGWWVDRRAGTFPWLTLVGGALGFAAGLMMLIRAGRGAFKD